MNLALRLVSLQVNRVWIVSTHLHETVANGGNRRQTLERRVFDLQQSDSSAPYTAQ